MNFNQKNVTVRIPTLELKLNTVAPNVRIQLPEELVDFSKEMKARFSKLWCGATMPKILKEKLW